MKSSDIINISEHKKELRTDTMQVPAILFDSDGTMPKIETLDMVEKMAGNSEIFHHVAVLSDAHPKPGIISPTGSVVSAETEIVPEFIDAAPNCGMRVVLTDLSDAEMTREKINGLFAELKNVIPAKRLVGTKISRATVLDIFQNGSKALKNIFDLRAAKEFENTYNGGNFFNKEVAREEILRSVPESIIQIGKYRLGLLGATKSHFLRLMRVSSVMDEDTANALGVSAGQYVFFLHTGSSIVGRYAASLFTRRKIKSLSQRIILFVLRLTTSKIKCHNLEMVFRAVSNYGFANRTLITHRLDQALEKAFGRQINLTLLYDSPHVYFDRERHFDKDVIVYRNGANRAFGPQRMAEHSVFGKTGEPVLIAPFAEKFGYVGVGTDQNIETFFSANHEIGKIKEISYAGDPEKYAEEVIAGLEENKIARIVAKLETIETLTY